VDEVCDRFEAAWLAGPRPQIEGYLGALPEPARPALFGELLRLDLHYRRQQLETPTEEELLRDDLAPGRSSAARSRVHPRQAGAEVRHADRREV
jgi:hypothetical protein